MPHIYAGNQERITKIAADAAAIAKDVASKHAADVDTKGRFPSETIEALGQQGFLGLTLPATVGGRGEGPRGFVTAVEEIAMACGSSAMVFVMHVSAAQTIASAATLADKDALLKDLALGKHLTTLALSEKGSRSEFWAPVSKLTASGEGWTTSAQKSWVTSAEHADSYVTSAQAPNAPSPLASTVYLLKKGARGVRVNGAFNGLGLRGNESSPVTYEGVTVKPGDLLSEQGKGADVKLGVVLPWFAIGTAAMANGLCRAAVAATAAHLSSATLEHKGQQLRDLPNLRMRLAEMSVRTEQARALLAHTISEMENPSPMTPVWVLQTRLASLQAAIDVTDLAMKAGGGAAFSKQLPLERLFRDARAGWVMAPTVDHLQDFVGKALTGLPLF